jgi:hypothetical protein
MHTLSLALFSGVSVAEAVTFALCGFMLAMFLLVWHVNQFVKMTRQKIGPLILHPNAPVAEMVEELLENYHNFMRQAEDLAKGNQGLVDALADRDALIRKCEVLLSPFMLPDVFVNMLHSGKKPPLDDQTQLVLNEYRNLIAVHAGCRQAEVQVELAKQHDTMARSVNAFNSFMEEHFPEEVKQARELNTPMFELVQNMLLRTKHPKGWFTSALSSAHTEGPKS